MFERPLPWWASASVIACAAAAGVGCFFRIQAERGNRAVGLALEAEALAERAALSGLTYAEGLERMKTAGLTGVTVSEERAETAISDGRITVSFRPGVVLAAGPTEVIDRLCRGLGRRSADFQCRTRGLAGGRAVAETAAPMAVIKSTSLGLPPELAKPASDAGLEIIARFTSIVGEDGGALQARLNDADMLGAAWLLPAGEAVPGFRSALPALAEVLQRLNWTYVTAEFVKLNGDSNVRAAVPDRTVRLHTASQAELAKMSDSAMRERFAKAQRERGMRWLLVRPAADAGPALEALGASVSGVAQEISRQEGTVAKPRPFTPPAMPIWLPGLIGLLAAPALGWLGWAMGGGRIRWALAVVGALAPLTMALPATVGYGALAVAIGFPLLGVAWLLGRSAPPAWLGLVVMALFALAGGMAVAGSMVGLDYMLQNELFPGVKASLYAPLALGLAVMLNRALPLRELLAKPIYWGPALLAIVGMGLVAFLLIRTGNDSPEAVSGLELRFRALLDQILYVRPRTKEFLIGWPALVAGLMLWRRGPGIPAALLIGFGMVGMAGMVNTFCHLHSPVHLAFARSAIGLVVGGILGAALGGVILRIPAMSKTP